MERLKERVAHIGQYAVTLLKWITFTRERGKEYHCIGFPSESEALQHMFDELVAIYAGDMLNHKGFED